MYWTLELASKLEDAPWPATKDELIDYAMRSGAPLEVIENLQEMEDEGEICALIDGMVTDQETITDELYEDATLHNPDGAWQSVFGLAVMPQKRQLGYASLLMMELIEKARHENRKGLILTCKKNLIPFYEQFGFVNKGLSASVHGGAAWYDMVLDFAHQPPSGF